MGVSWVSIAATLFTFGTAVFTAIKKPRDAAARWFVMTTLLLGGWMLSNLLCFGFESSIAARAAIACSTLLAPTGVMLALTLTRAPDATGRAAIPLALYGVGFVIAILGTTTSLIWKETRFEAGTYVQSDGPLLWVYATFFLGCFIYLIARLARHVRRATGSDRLRLQWVLLGTGAACGLAVTTNLVLPHFGIVDFMALGPSAAVVFLVATARAIIRYRLLGIETVLHRTASWIVVSLGLALPVGLGLAVARPWLLQLTTLEFTALAIGFLYAFLAYHQLVQPRIDHLFRRRRQQAELAIEAFVGELRALSSSSDVVRRIVELAGLFYPAGVAVYQTDVARGVLERVSSAGELLGPESLSLAEPWLDHIGAGGPLERAAVMRTGDDAQRVAFAQVGGEMICPMSAGGRVVGLIVLGHKVTLRPYDADDLRLLRSVASAGAVALSNAVMYSQVIRDHLTGAYNRLFAEEALRRMVSEAQRRGEHMIVMLLDLNRFKEINDTIGHAAGDAVLTSVAQRLGGALRAADVVARLGGDEFLVLLHLARPDSVSAIIDKLLGAVCRPVTFHGETIEVSTSIGAAVFPHDGTTPDALLRAADQAMYRHKGSKRRVS